MPEPRGKTPSLIGSSLGRPVVEAAGPRCKCSRCDEKLAPGETCYMVPQPSKPFGSPRRFCAGCFAMVLVRTKADLAELEAIALGTGLKA